MINVYLIYQLFVFSTIGQGKCTKFATLPQIPDLVLNSCLFLKSQDCRVCLQVWTVILSSTLNFSNTVVQQTDCAANCSKLYRINYHIPLGEKNDVLIKLLFLQRHTFPAKLRHIIFQSCFYFPARQLFGYGVHFIFSYSLFNDHT